MNARNLLLVGAVLVGIIGCEPPESVAPGPAEPATGPAADATSKTESKSEPEAALEPATELAPPTATNDQAPSRAVVRDEAVAPAQFAEPAKADDAQQRTTFYRLDAGGPAKVPPVLLSKGHEALCKVKVGDALPAIELPRVDGGQATKLADLYGKSATVVVFWKSDRRMAREELADLRADVVELFGEKGVEVVGVAVDETSASAQAALDKAGAGFVNLLDADGSAFAVVGSEKLPRTYLIDPQGKILWFDIEYSPSTRRELHQSLHAVTGAPPEDL